MASIAAEAKEYSLVEKLEFRIASTRSDEQLSELLAKFLAPLLLKLESEHQRVRDKTLRLAQHIQTRLQSQYVLAVKVWSSMLKQSQGCPRAGFRSARTS